MDYYMGIIKITLIPLDVFGLNPAKPLGPVRITYVTVMTFVLLYLIYIQFLYEEITLKLYSRILESSFITVHGALPLIPIILHKKEAWKLIQNVSKFWTYEDPDCEVQADYMRDLTFLRRTVTGFVGVAVAAVTTFLLRPLFSPDLALACHVPEFLPYFVVIVFNDIQTIAYTLIVVGFDTFACTLLLLLTLQFKILNHKLRTMKFGEIKTEDDRICFEKELKKCVDHHNFLFEFLDTFNELNSINFLIQYFLTTVLVCFELLLISKNPYDYLEVAKSLTALASLSVQLTILYCWPSLCVTLESSKTIWSVYDSDWILCNCVPIRKQLILIMQRSQKDAALSAGKMYSVSLETCTKIFKTSLSFYTYLNTLGQEKH